MARKWMQTALLAGGCAAFALSAVAQQPAPSDPYQGVAHPPSEMILTNESAPQPAPKPSAAKPATVSVASAPAPTSVQPAAAVSAPTTQSAAHSAPDPDADIVHPEAAPSPSRQLAANSTDTPVLAARPTSADPDSDIVHPQTVRPGELAEGTMFEVGLSERLSSADNEKGDRFHGKVLTDVMQNGKVLIPAGSTVEGRISAISSGHLAGHGSIRLTPQTLILPDSTRIALRAEVSGTPGSNHRIDDEGGIDPGSRKERAGIEYGAVTGAGAATGAVFGGPVGALAGGLIGAGMVTTHLVVSHPQTTLDQGTHILFTLTEPLNLMPSSAPQ